MGVRGLSTFIENNCTHPNYVEKASLHGTELVVDGMNLMYHLYFKLDSIDHEDAFAYLFGGGYVCYAQRIRTFFQHLKLCDIKAYIVFDGAYEPLAGIGDKIIDRQLKQYFSSKLQRTALRRFNHSLKASVKENKPGKKYTPALMRLTFLEVAKEQGFVALENLTDLSNSDSEKAPSGFIVQAEYEADELIWQIARRRGNVPIVSSDSDFHIFSCSVPKDQRNPLIVSCGSLHFKKCKGTWKAYVTHRKFLKFCDEKYKICRSSQKHLGVLPFLLGNDLIPRRLFSGTTNQKNRSEYVHNSLKWVRSKLGVKVNYILKEMAESITSTELSDFVYKIMLKQYAYYVPAIQPDSQDSAAVQDVTYELENMNIAQEKVVKENEDSVDELELTSTISNTNGEDESDDDIEELEGVEEDILPNFKKSVPLWFSIAHSNCTLPSELYKLYQNQLIFLTPQVEILGERCAHFTSTPIIKVTAGILLGPDAHFTTITRQGAKMVIRSLPVTYQLPIYGKLPTIQEQLWDLPLQKRRNIFLESLGVIVPGNEQGQSFVSKVPASVKFYVTCIIYFHHRFGTGNEVLREVVSRAILFCVLRNILCDHSYKEFGLSSSVSSISSTFKRISYRRVHCSRKLKKSSSQIPYDIKIANLISQFNCVVHHASMLNALLGTVYKVGQPALYLDNLLIFKAASYTTYPEDLIHFSNQVLRIPQK